MPYRRDEQIGISVVVGVGANEAENANCALQQQATPALVRDVCRTGSLAQTTAKVHAAADLITRRNTRRTNPSPSTSATRQMPLP